MVLPPCHSGARESGHAVLLIWMQNHNLTQIPGFQGILPNSLWLPEAQRQLAVQSGWANSLPAMNFQSPRLFNYTSNLGPGVTFSPSIPILPQLNSPWHIPSAQLVGSHQNTTMVTPVRPCHVRPCHDQHQFQAIDRDCIMVSDDAGVRKIGRAHV